jgi:excisionase family DNA binding protein
MNLSLMPLSELQKLKREIEDEISEREEEENQKFRKLFIESLRGTRHTELIKPEMGRTINETERTVCVNNLIGVRELAERLGVPKTQIYRLTHAGQLPNIRLGKYLRFDYLEVIESLRQAPE